MRKDAHNSIFRQCLLTRLHYLGTPEHFQRFEENVVIRSLCIATIRSYAMPGPRVQHDGEAREYQEGHSISTVRSARDSIGIYLALEEHAHCCLASSSRSRSIRSS